MNFQHLLSRAPITTLLIISFVGLFTIQVLTGVDIEQPDSNSLLNWGANFLPYTMSDEPWRLISSAFLHIGFMHLLFNAFAMYYLGQVAEVMVGSAKFALIFILSAIGGNLLNVYDIAYFQLLTDGLGVSAGASGGIMGIGGALLVLAWSKQSTSGVVLNFKSLAIILGINLIYGFAVPGIDNAGHIGGALTGSILATVIVFTNQFSRSCASIALTRKNGSTVTVNLITTVVFCSMALLFGALWLYLHNQLNISL